MSIEVGNKLEGKVTGITNFGAFVELSGGKTGLVHISEIADHYVKDVKDHLKINDTVTVKVINVDKDGKIGLSIRKAVDKPVQERERPSGPPPRRNHGGQRGFQGGRGGRGGGRGAHSFEDKLGQFLKDSEERMASLRKNTEAKRGGRGARRA